MTTDTKIKQQIYQIIESLPAEQLPKLLNFLKSLFSGIQQLLLYIREDSLSKTSRIIPQIPQRAQVAQAHHSSRQIFKWESYLITIPK